VAVPAPAQFGMPPAHVLLDGLAEVGDHVGHHPRCGRRRQAGTGRDMVNELGRELSDSTHAFHSDSQRPVDANFLPEIGQESPLQGRCGPPRHNGAVRVVEVDGSERSIRSLTQALADALDGGTPVLPVDATAPTAKDVVTAMRPDDPVPSSTAVLIATSGSTGHPKGVLLSAAALTASANATHARLGGPGRWLLATPAQYIGGLQVLVRSVLSGHEPGVLDLSAGFRPEAFAAAAEPVLSEPGPHYTALVPTQLV